MAFFLFSSSILLSFFFLFSSFFTFKVNSTTFTFTNKCPNTVWPATLSNSGTAPLSTTGFILPSGTSLAIQAPTGWSGRFWARTSCTTLSSSNHLTCATGDCGSGQIECSGAGATPPATLAEFTLAGPSSTKDFYDVSLVDGYNIPMMVVAANGGCESTGCAVDLNNRCPAELRVGEGEGEGCRSACEAFGKEEYCCSGEYANPSVCKPTVYSEMFKAACPRSYSYAFDDPSSTFTCDGPADYSIIFCPNADASSSSSSSSSSYGEDDDSSSPSQKSSRDGTTEPTTKGVVLEGGESWLANLAMGDAPSSRKFFSNFHQFLLILFLICLLF